MWYRRRVTRLAWTRRAHDAPAVVRNLPALIGEVLEDRTLLSGVTDSSDGEGSWAVLLGSESSLSFVLPVDSVSWLFAKDFGQELDLVAGDPSQEGVVPTSLHFRIDVQSSWRDVVKLSADAENSATDGSPVLVRVEFDVVNLADGANRFVNIFVEFVDEAASINSMAPTGESRFNLASDFDSPSPDANIPTGGLLATATFPIGFQSTGGVDRVSYLPLETYSGTELEDERRLQLSLRSGALEFVDQPKASFVEEEFTDESSMNSIGSLSDPGEVLAMLAAAAEPAGVSNPEVLATSPPDLFSATVLFTSSSSTGSIGAYDLTSVVISPVEGLQAAAAPLIAVVETVLASLDMTAGVLLALLIGSGGSTSPIAPVVQPIVDSSHVVIDPKRPRWALHDGIIEELAMYSMVVAPDQHFDLKDFGPAFRGTDPVVRIEFDVPPQHGQVSATEIPGSFRYTADPGFSGVDTARFQITRASGQTVAGAVTILVNGRGLLDRPLEPVRQVELPIRDQRLSNNGPSVWQATPAAIDLSFGLSDGGMDLP